MSAVALAAQQGCCAFTCTRTHHRTQQQPLPSATQPPSLSRRRQRTATRAASSGTASQPGGSAAAREAVITKDYLAWAQQSGIVSPKVTQAYFGELRGAAAVEDIAPDEVFVTVPRAAALVVAPNERCPCPDFVDPGFYKEAPWYVKMAVLLLWERQKERASPVWGYIEQLPASIDTPVRWSEAELAELQYAHAIGEIRQQQASWRQQYERFCKAVQPGVGCSFAWEEDFLWAMENVRSRAFSGPYTGSSVGEKARTLGLLLAAGGAYALWQQLPLEQALNAFISVLVFNIIYDLLISKKLKWYALCPVVDAINHSSLVESEVAYEYFRDTFVLSTKSAYKKGQQVFISYGAQSNGSLLQYYAFTERGNPNDVYVWQASIGGQQVQMTVNAKGSFAAECQAAVRGALGASGGDDAAVRRVLYEAAEAELASKPTSAADDERLLQTAHLMAPRQRAAAEFRLEKKRLLERAAAKARKRLDKAA
ncbi:hypothetical protein ABPG77_005771 [Micractinium sp. CCAP 211/92]